MLAKLASFTTMYKPNIITTPHKIARTKCCSDRSRASSLSKTDFFGGAAPFFHSFLRISISRICIKGCYIGLLGLGFTHIIVQHHVANMSSHKINITVCDMAKWCTLICVNSRPSDAVQRVSIKRFFECYFKAILQNLPKSLRHFRTLFRSFQNLIENFEIFFFEIFSTKLEHQF